MNEKISEYSFVFSNITVNIIRARDHHDVFYHFNYSGNKEPHYAGFITQLENDEGDFTFVKTETAYNDLSYPDYKKCEKEVFVNLSSYDVLVEVAMLLYKEQEGNI